MALQLTEKDAGEIKRVMTEQKLPNTAMLRVGVKGGGCSGFEYSLGFDPVTDELNDLVSDWHGVRVAVDKKSNLYLDGMENVPWSRACDDDGTFKSRDQLEQLYLVEQQLKPSDEIIAYCRIGERSSLAWYVLTYLLGFPKVKNYDGSWTEWGNLVGAPIEKTYAYKK